MIGAIISFFGIFLFFLVLAFIRCTEKPIEEDKFIYIIKNPNVLEFGETETVYSLDKSTILLIKKIYYSLWMYPNVEIVENILKEFFYKRQNAFIFIRNIGIILSIGFGLLGFLKSDSTFFVGGISGSIFLLIAIFLQYRCNAIFNRFISGYIGNFIESEKIIYNISGSRSGAYQLMNELTIQLNSTKNSFEAFCKSLQENSIKLGKSIDRIIETSSGNIDEMVQANKKFITEITGSIDMLIDSSKKLTEHTKDLTVRFGAYEQSLRLTENQGQMLVNNAVSITKNIGNFITSIENAKDVIATLIKTSMKLSKVSEMISQNQNDLNKIIEKLDKSLSLYDMATKNQIEIQRKIQKIVENIKNSDGN